MTYAQIQAINEKLPTIDQKGKKYVMVHARILGFRELHPEGCISTEVLHMDDEKVVMKTTITDEEGKILGTGIASEKFGDSFITRTSAFEVCETSSIGRAIGTLGIGIDSSFASAEEVANAMIQQNDKRDANDVERASFEQLCTIKGVKPQDILRKCGWKSGKMTVEHFGKALIILKDMEDGQ